MEEIMIKIVKFNESVELIKQLFSNMTLIPVIGAGFTAGSIARNGVVPNGAKMKLDMEKAILAEKPKTDLKNKSFFKVARYYNSFVDKKIRKQYLYDNFIDVKLPQLKKEFLDLNWPYIYTLNIDDAIEKNAKYEPIGPNKEIETISFDAKLVYKLHGDAREIVFLKNGESFSIFDTDQYIDSLKRNKDLLNKLKQDYIDKNIIFIGCSLENEIDLLSVFSLVKNEEKNIITEKFYVTSKEPMEEDLIDLESYGITKVILIDSYDGFYEGMVSIIKSISRIKDNELNIFKNIQVVELNAKDKSNKEYLLYNKNPYNKQNNLITLPYFFISRKISEEVVNNLNKYPIQFVYGKRVSGKTYFLLDIYRKFADRDKFYFDSRMYLNKDNINSLLKLKNTIFLIDTKVLSEEVLSYIMQIDHKELISKQLNFVICIDSGSKEMSLELRKYREIKTISIYYLSNVLSNEDINDEYASLKNKLTTVNLPYFDKRKTILDSLVWIQDQVLGNGRSLILTDFYIASNKYLYFAYLILLAHYGKLTTLDLINFDVIKESNELMPKLDKVVEPDFRYMITASALDNSYYQVVCNAQVWMLGYLSRISLKSDYFESITKAVVYIVEHIINLSIRESYKRKKLYDFIKFDNINMLLGRARNAGQPFGVRKLIQNIYGNLKGLLGNDYQFNHQYSKCLLWGIEELPEMSRNTDLKEALNASIIAIQLVEEAKEANPRNEYLMTSLAHIQFTISMIKVKMFFFNKSEATFFEALKQLKLALSFPANQDAHELYDDYSDDDNDYSISKFMDYIVSEEAKEYGSKLKRQINWLINFRFVNKKR